MERKTLYTDSYNVLKDFLKRRVSDPSHRNKKRFPWIHNGFPNLKKSDYPFIILQSANVSDADYVFGRTEREFQFRFLITVYSKDGSKCDMIAEDILQAFDDNRDDLNENKLYSLQISSSPFRLNENERGDKIYTRELGIILKTRL